MSGVKLAARLGGEGSRFVIVVFSYGCNERGERVYAFIFIIVTPDGRCSFHFVGFFRGFRGE